MGRNFTTKSLCFLTIGLLSHCYGKKKCVYSNVFSYHIASKLCNGYKSVSKKEALQNCKAPFNMLYKSNYLDYSMMFLTTPEPTVRPPSRDFLPVLSSVFDVFSGFLYTENMNFLCIIYIIQSSWHRFGTAKKQVFPKHCWHFYYISCNTPQLRSSTILSKLTFCSKTLNYTFQFVQDFTRFQ